MPGVQFGNQIDMNGFKVTELAAGVDPTDAVNVSQLNTAVGGFAGSVGDGVATSFVVTHNLGTRDVLTAVFDNATPWDEFDVQVQHTSTNTVTVIFGAPPALNAYRVLVKRV